LARACPDYTAIVLTGRNLSLVRQSCRLARLLAPSIVILEDVDLIAVERRENFHAPLLHDLLEEMDGLGRKTDCIFLLTTNRPEVLEPALASRPGRVDQAIFFPLPDVNCRRRLFGLFLGAETVSSIGIRCWTARKGPARPFCKSCFARRRFWRPSAGSVRYQFA
jgi:ATP-dependent 26S proteasome regulatory subunit